MWKYWRDLPPRGEIGIVLGFWYHEALVGCAEERFSAADFSHVLLISFGCTSSAWNRSGGFAGSRGAAVSVVRSCANGQGSTAGKRDRIIEAAAETVRITSSGHSPWHVVPAADRRYRDVAVGKLVLLQALREANSISESSSGSKAAEAKVAADGRHRPGLYQHAAHR